MAMAVQKLYPGAQVTIGPAIERGFYYDFAMPEPITEKDLKAVKKEMQRIIKADLPFVREEVSKPFCQSLAAKTSIVIPRSLQLCSCSLSCQQDSTLELHISKLHFVQSSLISQQFYCKHGVHDAMSTSRSHSTALHVIDSACHRFCMHQCF